MSCPEIPVQFLLLPLPYILTIISLVGLKTTCPKVYDGLCLKIEAKKQCIRNLYFCFCNRSWLSAACPEHRAPAQHGRCGHFHPNLGARRSCYHSYFYHNVELENLVEVSFLQHRRCFASCRNLIFGLQSEVATGQGWHGKDVTVAVSVEQGDMFLAVCCESYGNKPRKRAFPSSCVSVKMRSASGELVACLWTLGTLPSCCLSPPSTRRGLRHPDVSQKFSEISCTVLNNIIFNNWTSEAFFFFWHFWTFKLEGFFIITIFQETI